MEAITPEMEQRTAIFAQLSHPVFGKLSVTTTNINNYAYYLQPDAASLAIAPKQLSSGINLLQLDWEGGCKLACISLGYEGAWAAA
jgi:hypothetical protein